MTTPVSSILIVDPDEGDRDRLRRMLLEAGFSDRVQTARSGREARERLSAAYFDCVFVSAQLGDGAGIALVPVVSNHRDRPGAATIVTGSGDEREVVAAMRGGAAEYLSKTRLQPELVRAAIENGMLVAQQQSEQRDMRRRLNHLAMFDGRTGLPNRALFCDRLAHAVLIARRNRQSLAVMVMNLDFFKDLNDGLGRAVGDAVLTEVGTRIRNAMRGSDTLARLRGDEFAALLPGVQTHQAASVVAEKINAATSVPIDVGAGQVIVGISIGIAMFPEDGQGPEALFNNADAAMYHAKRGTIGYAFHGRRSHREAALANRPLRRLGPLIEQDRPTSDYTAPDYIAPDYTGSLSKS